MRQIKLFTAPREKGAIESLWQTPLAPEVKPLRADDPAAGKAVGRFSQGNGRRDVALIGFCQTAARPSFEMEDRAALDHLRYRRILKPME